MKTKINLLFVIFTLAAIALTGCGKKPDQKTDGDKKDTSKQTTTNQNQVAGDNKTSTNPDSKTNELGIKEGMPADYPKDVPQPISSKCLGSLNTTEGTVVTFESSEKPKAILTPFTADLEKAGFKKGEGEMMSDDGGMVMWNKDKREVSIMLAWDKEKNNSSIVVTYK